MAGTSPAMTGPFTSHKPPPQARRGGGSFRHATATAALQPLGAAADLELLALVAHLRDRAEHLQTEVAVGLAIDLHGALVLDHIARRRIDRDMSARPVGRPAYESRDHLGAVAEIAVHLLDGVEDRVHRVPRGRSHEVRILVRTIGLVERLDE